MVQGIQWSPHLTEDLLVLVLAAIFYMKFPLALTTRPTIGDGLI